MQISLQSVVFVLYCFRYKANKFIMPFMPLNSINLTFSSIDMQINTDMQISLQSVAFVLYRFRYKANRFIMPFIH